jgi:UDP-GlcNAc:undecaprenyl-phosphate GlcNAc-1-phosphate transferase
MAIAILGFVVSSFILSLIATGVAMRIGDRLNAHDGQGVAGQVKAQIRKIPNTGGSGIAISIAVTLAGTFAAVQFLQGSSSISSDLVELASSASANATFIWSLLIGLIVLHVMGVIDDRRPMHWLPKIVMMLVIPAGLCLATDSRVLTMLDPYAGGSWLSIVITTLWFAVVMNSMNFLDNMDGLAGGLAAIIGSALLVVSCLNQQWFIAAGSACLVGATLGFMPFNFPRARVFMGDGGSLVVGYMIAFLTIRLNFVESSADQPGWHQLFVPLVLLAVPLYDFVSVVMIRLAQGKSPFVGDLQHFSHRMARRGMGTRGSVLSIWALTAITCGGAIVMSKSAPWQGSVIIAQTVAALLLLVYLERGLPEKSA